MTNFKVPSSPSTWIWLKVNTFWIVLAVSKLLITTIISDKSQYSDQIFMEFDHPHIQTTFSDNIRINPVRQFSKLA